MNRIVLVILVVLAAGSALALEPAEVLVVYNGNVTGSKELAEYYIARRGIPAGNVVAITYADKQPITRDDFL